MASRRMLAFVIASFLLCLMTRADECALECQNDGVCSFQSDIYNAAQEACYCPSNFYGELCEFECTLNCLNGGWCFSSEVGTNTTEEKCQCTFLFEGDLCETERQCELNCENGGYCMLSQSSAYCECPFDWKGDICTEPCPCQNGGSCVSGWFQNRKLDQDEEEQEPFWDDDANENGYYCNCGVEYYGSDCQFETFNEECTLECQNGGYCSTKEFFGDDDSGNYEVLQFCTCQQGYNGDYCEVMADGCTIPCRNGGVCTSDEVSVQGGHDRVLQAWGGRDDDDIVEDDFLDNDDYEDDAEDSGYYCTCQEGYSGDYCEVNADGCAFLCQNGGVCTSDETSVQGGHDRVLEDWGGRDDYCTCQEGFFGDFCERKECGSGFCANGAACILLPSGQTAPGGGDYVCDCSAGFFNDIYAAGRHCESIANEICDFGQENPNEPWICTNFGRCIPTETECSCTGGYEGPRCEYSAVNAEENLEWGNCGLLCQNGGKCLKGVVKPLADIFFPFLEATKSSELFSYAPTDDFEYCYCPPGFFGVQCDEQYEICDGGEHICFHGSTCQNGTGDQWECDCSEALAAGLYCQYEATDICDDQDVTKFCTNDGTCSSATDTM
jgi:hypothetical protein